MPSMNNHPVPAHPKTPALRATDKIKKTSNCAGKAFPTGTANVMRFLAGTGRDYTFKRIKKIILPRD